MYDHTIQFPYMASLVHLIMTSPEGRANQRSIMHINEQRLNPAFHANRESVMRNEIPPLEH